MTRVTRYATAREAASHYGISTRTLARLRANGGGPAWERIGRSVRYPIATIPGTITVLSENPLGAPGDVLPDPHAPWRVLVESQRLVNRPGFRGGSQSPEDESHGCTEEVPGRAA